MTRDIYIMENRKTRLVSKGRSKSLDYNIYIDESGNTGNIEVCEDLSWNFKDQKHFALGAFYIEEEKADTVRQGITEILHNYDIGLGTENELKSKAKYKFKIDLFDKLTKFLIDNKVGSYFDISDKKYKVVMNITEYCVYPYYLHNFLGHRTDRINMANFLYKSLTQDQIKDYIDICQGIYGDDEIVGKLVKYLVGLKNHFDINKQNSESIVAAINYIQNYKSNEVKVDNLLPVKDFNNKGKKESFLPNVDAFNNLVGSISNLRIGNNSRVNIYHDDQKQFSDVLLYWSNEMGINRKLMTFCDSKDDVLIQTSDFYTGNILRLYRKIIESNYLKREERDLLKILKPLFYNCNIVACNYDQKRFFDTCGIKTRMTPIPF